MTKCFHNQRILINSDGNEITSHMEYNDVMVFNVLMPGSFFGGRTLMPFEHY